MAEIEEPSTPPAAPPSTAVPDLTPSPSKPSISSSISIWPSTQRTRDAVITRLIVAASESGEEDGIAVLQVYSRKISRRVLFAVKSKGVTVQESERKPETEIETKAGDQRHSRVCAVVVF